MKLLSLLKKDLLILLRDRVEMAVLFLMPLAFIIPISLALGSGDGYGFNRDNHMILLSVVDYDGGPRAEQLITAIGESLAIEKGYTQNDITGLKLQNDPECADIFAVEATAVVPMTPTFKVTETPSPDITETPGPTPTVTATPVPRPVTVDYPACGEKIARTLLLGSRRAAALIIPPDFSSIIDQNNPVTVTLLYDPAGDSTNFQQIEGVVKGAAVKISVENRVKSGLTQMADLAAFAPPEILQAMTQTPSPTQTPQAPVIQLEKLAPTDYIRKITPDTYQQTIPGYTVMYVFFIITSLAGSIRREKLNGTFRRLITAPVSRAEIVGGKLLATMVVGIIQVLILFGIGALFFKLDLGSDPLGFLVLTIALVAAATAIGMAASTTRMRGGGLAAPLVIAALLGGCIFPLDLMPAFLRSVSMLVPHSWALSGYQSLMVRDQGLPQIMPQIGVLLLFALVFFLIAIRRFDFEK